jgi:pyruvate/2-oxoglutarate/acetoin dehydrogenase E1 component/TPP-dependent pyruvate/acetoin dehydrogenase alpha subunit
MSKETLENAAVAMDFQSFKEEILRDYKLACTSREASLLGRREVLTGKAKFGIFGDGKELAQIALAKQFQNGDFRSGYYRDQTIMMAIGELNVKQYFAALYAHTDIEKEPASGGRQMGGHYATRSLDEQGNWKNLMLQRNSSADISPTAGQMPRLLGLAQASKVYRENELLHTAEFEKFSNKGNEVAFGTIGDASTSEGPFWETMNAAGVLQVPMVMSVWDDGYGISVSKKYQTIKENISEALAGFQRTEDKPGFEIFKTKGWNYPHLVATYEKAVKIAREEHVPVLVHVEEVNQPQGHSTSGSHERYKSEERMQWEQDFDCIAKFKAFILDFKTEDGAVIATPEELEAIEKEAKTHVRDQKNEAWKEFTGAIKADIQNALDLMTAVAAVSPNKVFIEKDIESLRSAFEPIRKDILNVVRKVLRTVRGEQTAERQALLNWLNDQFDTNFDRYSGQLLSESAHAALRITPIAAEYADEEKLEDGRVVLRENFDALFSKYPEILTFGEDTGKIGGVNQSMEGMQAKYGKLRVSDTGIRECTILGQGIGMAMRGLRPIAEIQYLDYLLYAIQIMSDDLATVQYRTKGGQKAPLIVRTRGHRLEGIWHSGSPMGMIINAIRGIHVCVPRNMTQAAGMYNTLIQADEPALVIEPLNGYRTKERIPTNLGEFRVALGIPDTVREGEHLTMLSYGSTFNICIEACKELEKLGVSVELIDVQTLLPFDIHHTIVESLEKTNRLMIVDEDVSSGATAYILDQVLVKQGGYYHLDSAPVTLSAKDHRPAYGSDGDYFSKPSFDDIVETAYAIMHEAQPQDFPAIR